MLPPGLGDRLVPRVTPLDEVPEQAQAVKPAGQARRAGKPGAQQPAGRSRTGMAESPLTWEAGAEPAHSGWLAEPAMLSGQWYSPSGVFELQLCWP